MLALAPVAVLVLALVASAYGRYLRISRGKAALLCLAAVIAAIGLGICRDNVMERGQAFVHFGNSEFDDFLAVASAALLPLVAIPFLLKLYLTWLEGAVSDAEKASGMEGIRVWLRGGNLVCALLISFCVWIGFGYSFWSALALALMALLAYPLLNMATTSVPSTASPSDPQSPERERVLKMLDDGKITAQESAELLNALALSAQPRTPPSPPATSPHRKMVLIGLALLLIGFFLPWFVIQTGDLQQSINHVLGQTPLPEGFPNGLTTVYVTGGNISNGLGWCVLLLGIVAAALPFVATNLDARTLQKTSLMVLCVGGIILIFLLTQNIRFTGIGLLLGLSGYTLEVIGVLKSRELDWVPAH